MDIEFYEEFPTKKNLEKLKLIKFPTKLFVASNSFKKFKKTKKLIKKINKKIKIAYWPIIKNSYWISPFSNTQDLKELFIELNKWNNPLLIDLELPLKKSFILKNILYYFKNKKIIKEFLINNKKRITIAQFPSSLISPFLKILGLDYKVDIEKSLMWYSSMNSHFMNKNIKKHLLKLKNKDKYSISLGTIAKGILGNEPILKSKNLKNDLEFIKKLGFKKIIIFRVGGLNKKYINIINQFTNK